MNRRQQNIQFPAFDTRVSGLTPENVVVKTSEDIEQQIEKISSIPTSHLVNTVTSVSQVISDATNVDTQQRYLGRGWQRLNRESDPIILADTAPMIGQSSLEASFVPETYVDPRNNPMEGSMDISDTYQRKTGGNHRR